MADELPPWNRCQYCDKPLTKETTVRVVIDRDVVQQVTKHHIAVYLHGPCAVIVFPPR